LDTNEIKTVERQLPIPINQQNNMMNSGENISNIKSLNSINNDSIKKVIKSKKINDEFSCSWALDIMKNYIPDQISSSPKMEYSFAL